MRKSRGGGGPFHLQCGIWHWITFWGWDAEHEQNKFIWKELLCPENSPIVRRVKLCIYMQCGGLARLLSVLQALSWLDFNMTDSHQVQTQMEDVGILPREDWNSSWHSESCTRDGHFTEMWVKTAVAQHEGVGNVEEILSPSENSTSWKEVSSPGWEHLKLLSQLLCSHRAAEAVGNLLFFFPHPDLDGLCCWEESQGLLPALCEGATSTLLEMQEHITCLPWTMHKSVIEMDVQGCLNNSIEGLSTRVVLCTNRRGIFFPFNQPSLFAVCVFLSPYTTICSSTFWAATAFVLLVWFFLCAHGSKEQAE